MFYWDTDGLKVLFPFLGVLYPFVTYLLSAFCRYEYVTDRAKPSNRLDPHAYYLDYQNRRAAHLAALWQIVNWKEIEARY